ncbi:hypothetical protein Q31b_51260 [Novipirellula aureliae]|uniref:Uncharacterized protein n=1 Tax=Novipirellula aureliae TaxID=2527966 RepID=A0A5C6DJD2_9BACT|nr:hypothetical protein [Novipirellula aureliae]TWU35691.1 hypothetical protein Q31b_51260 [Novipirellula aureliae]
MFSSFHLPCIAESDSAVVVDQQRHSDNWRLPAIKGIPPLILFRGEDIDIDNAINSDRKPINETSYFDFVCRDVDFTRSPDTTNSTASVPLFKVTPIRDALIEVKHPYCWPRTTYEPTGRSEAAINVVYGRSQGLSTKRTIRKDRWLAGPHPMGLIGRDRSGFGTGFDRDGSGNEQ